MTISMDYRDSLNAHFINKKEEADRLTLLALRYAYNKLVKSNIPMALNTSKNNQQITGSFFQQLSVAVKKELLGFEILTEKVKHI